MPSNTFKITQHQPLLISDKVELYILTSIISMNGQLKAESEPIITNILSNIMRNETI